MPRTSSTAVGSCRHQAVGWWWGGGCESPRPPLSPAKALSSQPQYGAHPDLPSHVVKPGLPVSSNLLLQIISSLLVLLLLLLPHPSFCNNETIWKKGGLVCQPAMLPGVTCGLSPLHTSPYIYLPEKAFLQMSLFSFHVCPSSLARHLG